MHDVEFGILAADKGRLSKEVHDDKRRTRRGRDRHNITWRLSGLAGEAVRACIFALGVYSKVYSSLVYEQPSLLAKWFSL